MRRALSEVALLTQTIFEKYEPWIIGVLMVGWFLICVRIGANRARP